MVTTKQAIATPAPDLESPRIRALRELDAERRREDAERQKVNRKVDETEAARASHEYAKILAECAKAIAEQKKFKANEGGVYKQMRGDIRTAHVPPDLASALEAVQRELYDAQANMNRALGGLFKGAVAPEHYDRRIQQLRDAQRALEKLVFVEDYEAELAKVIAAAHLLEVA